MTRTAVNWAAASGIMNGYEGDLFGPEDAVTREQMAVILYRYAQYKEHDTAATSDLTGYRDADAVSAFALPALQWASAEGLISGTDAAEIDPHGTATRAQVAVLLMRFCGLVFTP